MIKNKFEITPADLSVCKEAANFLQSDFWGTFKGAFGWKPRAFMVSASGASAPLLVLSRPLAAGFSLAYIPWGPQDFLHDEDGSLLAELAAALKNHLPHGTMFARFDPPGATPLQVPKGFYHAAAAVQPPDTVVLDLRSQVEDILAQMKNKWRYNIRLAEKKVTVKVVSSLDTEKAATTLDNALSSALEIFYTLFRETAARDGIALHSIDYYKKLFETARIYNVDVRLYLAFYEGESGVGEAVAGIVTVFYAGVGTYLYGASSSRNRNLMAPYALQWRAMRDAKDASCTEYDLFGIPPNDDPKHPMAGLYRFKTGFGGKIIHRPGSLDFPYNGLFYTLFRFAETARKKLRDMKKRRA
jgi:lipid II:glycine glycyltransferase (peptidoglycan interpeptide bridge formation enzyme)